MTWATLSKKIRRGQFMLPPRSNSSSKTIRFLLSGQQQPNTPLPSTSSSLNTTKSTNITTPNNNSQTKTSSDRNQTNFTLKPTSNNQTGSTINNENTKSSQVASQTSNMPATRKFCLGKDVLSATPTAPNITSPRGDLSPLSITSGVGASQADRRRSSCSSNSSSPTATNSILYLNLEQEMFNQSNNQRTRYHHHRGHSGGSNGSGSITEYSFTADDLLSTTSQLSNMATPQKKELPSNQVLPTIITTSSSGRTRDKQDTSIFGEALPGYIVEYINLDLTSILPHGKLLRFFLLNNQNYFSILFQILSLVFYSVHQFYQIFLYNF